MNTILVYCIAGTVLLVAGLSQLIPTMITLVDAQGLSVAWQLMKSIGLLFAGFTLLIVGLCAEYSKGKEWKE